MLLTDWTPTCTHSAVSRIRRNGVLRAESREHGRRRGAEETEQAEQGDREASELVGVLLTSQGRDSQKKKLIEKFIEKLIEMEF